MKRKKSKIGKYAYDHWLAIFPYIITIGGIGFLYIVRDILIAIINWQYSGWIVSSILLIVGLIIYPKNKKPVEITSVMSIAPKYAHQKFEPTKMYGVIWRFWRGNNVPSAFDYAFGDKPLKGWVDGPFCPECDYELETNTKRTKWVCIQCQDNFSIPADIQDNTIEKVVKIFEANIRKQEHKDAKNLQIQ